MRRCLGWAPCKRYHFPLWRACQQPFPFIRHSSGAALRHVSGHGQHTEAFQSNGGRRPLRHQLTFPAVAQWQLCDQTRSGTRAFSIKTRRNPAHGDKPDPWLQLVDEFLPPDLRVERNETTTLNIRRDESGFENAAEVLEGAWRATGVNLLTFMVLIQKRHIAAYHLVGLLLEPVATPEPDPGTDQLPSNLDWPFDLTAALSSSFMSPIDVKATTHPSQGSAETWVQPFEYDMSSAAEPQPMSMIWTFLADLILEATGHPSERSRDIMNTVLKVIAHLHNLGLIPKNVYDYTWPRGSTITQRPPILHELSSRILSALADAVWRSHSEETTSTTQKSGADVTRFGAAAPGKRVNVEVPEIRPELWLEFVLWCCVDSGLAETGMSIFNKVRERVNSPWSAVHWTLIQTNSVTDSATDSATRPWRGTGPGKSVEQLALADGSPGESSYRIISFEVVLALIDSTLNNIDIGIPGHGISIRKATRNIASAIAFLGPETLGSKYLDYVTVRLMKTGSIIPEIQPKHLRAWCKATSKLTSPELKRPRVYERELSMQRILECTQVQMGISHQMLQAYIGCGNAKKALDAFNEIQLRVDESKLSSIELFTSHLYSRKLDFFTSRTARRSLEFINTHGQLPLYQLAAVLDLATEARLFGLGDWLLHSEDIDGPVLPPSVYNQLVVAVSLTRYAAARKAPTLVGALLNARRNFRRKPSVNLLRALVNSQITIHEWDSVQLLLLELTRARGGGFAPATIAYLASTILRLEGTLVGSTHDSAAHHLGNAVAILRDLLRGKYDGRLAEFSLRQKRLFRQQVGDLLKIFIVIPDSRLQSIAAEFLNQFPSSNAPKLHTSTFDILLCAIIECRGASEGRQLWELFCKLPEHGGEHRILRIEDDLLEPEPEPEPVVANDDGFDDSYKLRSGAQLPILTDDHVPVIVMGSSGEESPRHLYSSDTFSHVLDLDSEGVGLPTPKVELIGGASQTDPTDPVPIAHDYLDKNSQRYLHVEPIVLPTLRTLQIIVRGMLAEKRVYQKQGTTVPVDYDAILEWAKRLYKCFGNTQGDFDEDMNLPPSIRADKMTLASATKLYPERIKSLKIDEPRRATITDKFSQYSYLTRQPSPLPLRR